MRPLSKILRLILSKVLNARGAYIPIPLAKTGPILNLGGDRYTGLHELAHRLTHKALGDRAMFARPGGSKEKLLELLADIYAVSKTEDIDPMVQSQLRFHKGGAFWRPSDDPLLAELGLPYPQEAATKPLELLAKLLRETNLKKYEAPIENLPWIQQAREMVRSGTWPTIK